MYMKVISLDALMLWLKATDDLVINKTQLVDFLQKCAFDVPNIIDVTTQQNSYEPKYKHNPNDTQLFRELNEEQHLQ